MDHILNPRNRVFARLSWYDRDSLYDDYFHNAATGASFQFISRNAILDYVGTLSSNMIMNLRYGYNRLVRANDMKPESRGFDLTTLGFPKSLNDVISPEIRRFPRIDLVGYATTGQTCEFRPNDMHFINVTINKIAGLHSLKGGMEFRAYRETDTFTSNDQSGRYWFDATFARGPLDNSPTAPSNYGQSVAAMLLGRPSGSNSLIARTASYAEQSTNWSYFFHDDWRIGSRLTLNLGLRWEFEGALTERYNRSVKGFDFHASAPFEAQAKSNYAKNPTAEIPPEQFTVKGGLTFSNVNGLSRGLYETPKINLMPRLGLAYRLAKDGKTILRGGYGIFYGFLGQLRGDVIQSGFSQNTPFIGTSDGINFSNTLSNPFPTGVVEPAGAANGIMTFVGQGISFFEQKPKMPYMQRWQLGLQRQLPGGWVAELAYVGNRGTHLDYTRNLNATPNQYLGTSSIRDQNRINYLSSNIANPFLGLLPAGAITGLAATTISRERLLRPYPHFDSVNTTEENGYSWYHSMRLRIDKRFSQGYMLGFDWTWSKYMQATELLNPADVRPVETISDSDRPHRVSISGIYEFPFGQGRRFLSEVHPFWRAILEGWELCGIFVYQTGAPLSWGNVLFTGDVKEILLSSTQPNVDLWFNPSAGFERDSTKQLESNLRTFPLRYAFIRSDNTSNMDLSLIKKVFNREKKHAEFRAEFLNAFNHPLLPAPNMTPTALTFGRIFASTQANYPRRIQLSLKFVF